MDTIAVRAPGVTNWQRLAIWAGRLISVAPVAIVLLSARWKLTSNPWYVQEFGRIGWTTPALPLLAGLQLTAIILFVIPQTAVLGAVLLTGYLGGAVASYVRIGEPYPAMVPFTTAVLRGRDSSCATSESGRCSRSADPSADH